MDGRGDCISSVENYDEVRYFYGDNIKEKPNGKNQSVSDAEAHVVD